MKIRWGSQFGLCKYYVAISKIYTWDEGHINLMVPIRPSLIFFFLHLKPIIDRR